MKAVVVGIASVVTLLAVAHAGAVTSDRGDVPTGHVGAAVTVDAPPARSIPFAATASLGVLASVSEPSGLVALAVVMVTLGVGLVMRLAQELRVFVSRCARYRIELTRVRRWWVSQRPHAR